MKIISSYISLFLYTAQSLAADSSNYSPARSLKDSFWGLFTQESYINCSECKTYLADAYKYAQREIEERSAAIKKSLDEQGTRVLVEPPAFSFAAHEVAFDGAKHQDKPIPICSQCCGLIPDYEGDDDYPFMLTTLGKGIIQSSSMTQTSHQGTNFGCVFGGITPVWHDIFTTGIPNQNQVNFLELGSGFNLKPLYLWLMGKGRINCTLNDINSDLCLEFIKRYSLIDPRQLNGFGRQSFITLNKSNFLTGSFRHGQKYNIVVITNVFHYFTAEQVATAMQEIHAMLDDGGIAYIQAFSGTDKDDVINPFLADMLGVQSNKDPLYLSKSSEQINAYSANLYKRFGDDKRLLTARLNLRDKLPSIAHTSSKPFSFFPRASLEKLAQDYGFNVITSGLFDITTPTGGKGEPQRTPYFSWVKLQKR